MADDATTLLDQALRELTSANDGTAIEAWRIAVLGRNGSLTALMSQIGSLPAGQRRAFGAAANQAKQQLESAFAERSDTLRRATLDAETAQAIDVTLPGRPIAVGRYHPTTQIVREISGIFERMGFSVVEGPEVEWDYRCWTALKGSRKRASVR